MPKVPNITNEKSKSDDTGTYVYNGEVWKNSTSKKALSESKTLSSEQSLLPTTVKRSTKLLSAITKIIWDWQNQNLNQQLSKTSLPVSEQETILRFVESYQDAPWDVVFRSTAQGQDEVTDTYEVVISPEFSFLVKAVSPKPWNTSIGSDYFCARIADINGRGKL